jgi:hypothetical protein
MRRLRKALPVVELLLPMYSVVGPRPNLRNCGNCRSLDRLYRNLVSAFFCQQSKLFTPCATMVQGAVL